MSTQHIEIFDESRVRALLPMPRAVFIPKPLSGGVVEREAVAVRNLAARKLVDALLASLRFELAHRVGERRAP